MAKVEKRNDDFEVWEDCWEAVLFFCACQYRWRYKANLEKTVLDGLDVPQIESDMRLRGWKRKKQQAMWADLLVMETAAMQVINEREK